MKRSCGWGDMFMSGRDWTNSHWRAAWRLNCVATGRLSSEGPFKSLWTQPAAGDAGGALGAALWFWHQRLNQPRSVQKPDGMRGAFLGPEIAPQSADDDAMLRRLGAVWESLPDDALQERIVEAIGQAKSWRLLAGGWNLVRGRSARGRFWAMHARRRCSRT